MLQCFRWLPQIWFDRVASLWVRPQLSPTAKKRLGILRLGGLGDFVLFLPALKAILHTYPETEYQHYLVTDHNGAELAKLDNQFGQVAVISIDGSRFIHNIVYRVRTLRMIRRFNFDLLIDAALSRRIEGNDAIVRASGSMAVGFRPLPDQICERRLGDYYYNTLVDYVPYREHEILRYFRLIGRPQKPDESLLPIIHLSQPHRKADQFLVFPGAKFPQRRWPSERFAELAKFVHQRTGWTPVAAGTYTDGESISKMIDASPYIPWRILQNQSIHNLCEEILLSRLVVTNDSGPMHLSPALKTMTVAIVPGAEFSAYPSYPVFHQYLRVVHQNDKSCFNCNWNCAFQANKKRAAYCLSNISVNDVILWLDDFLGGTHSDFS